MSTTIETEGCALSARPTDAKPVAFRPRAHRRKLENRDRILAEARKLFGRKGFDAVTTAEIAEAANVAKGSVFAHVGSKDRLLVLVFERDMHKWLDDASARAGRRPLLNQLDRFFNAMLDGAAEAPELTLVFMRELPYAQPRAGDTRGDGTHLRSADGAHRRGEGTGRSDEVGRHENARPQPLRALLQLPVPVVGGGHAAA